MTSIKTSDYKSAYEAGYQAGIQDFVTLKEKIANRLNITDDFQLGKIACTSILEVRQKYPEIEIHEVCIKAFELFETELDKCKRKCYK